MAYVFSGFWDLKKTDLEIQPLPQLLCLQNKEKSYFVGFL